MSGDTCIKCGKADIPLSPIEVEYPDEYGIACSEPSVPTSFTVMEKICKECDWRLLNGVDVDSMSVEEIDKLIVSGKFSEQDMVDFYGNPWWRETP